MLSIVAGGQTGVDRAALDVAIALGLPRGGWCPAGRRAEDGRIPSRYPLRETPLADPSQRTWWNVRDSDATLVVADAPPRGGTALALVAARALGRPWLLARPGSTPPVAVRGWLRRAGIRVLNVAGPRESECPGIYRHARAFLRQVLAPLAARGRAGRW